MKKIYNIGRKADNDIIIANPKVSAYHAKITKITDNVILIEDLDSTNGTFKNNKRIKRSLFTKEDLIVLADAQLDLNKFYDSEQVEKPHVEEIKVLENTVAEEKPLSEEEKIYQQFQELKKVYDTYRDAKLKIQKGIILKKDSIRAALSLIPLVGSAIGIMASHALNKQEKLFALDEEFKIAYTCPKCRTYLGNVPWEGLVNRKICRSCKVKWLEQ